MKLVALVTLALLWSGLLLAGAVLIGQGLRGRQVGADPRCRRCGYNIGGTGTRPARCPECGGRLTGASKVRLGNWAPRRTRLVTGALLIVVTLSPSIFLVRTTGAPVAPAAVVPAAPVRPWAPPRRQIVPRRDRAIDLPPASGIASGTTANADAPVGASAAIPLTPPGDSVIDRGAVPYTLEDWHALFGDRPPAGLPAAGDGELAPWARELHEQRFRPAPPPPPGR